MTIDTAEAARPNTLDLRTLLARINHRITLLRTWMSHDHRDEPFWWARKLTASDAQMERERMRVIANLLHVARATDRGRVHGTRFADLEAQRAWLDAREQEGLLPGGHTLAQLRAGKVAS